MKKLMVFGAIVLVAVLALGVAGFAYAQSPAPQTPVAPFGAGRMYQQNPNGYAGALGARRGGPMGMRGFQGQAVDGTYGPLHEYQIEALAQAFGLTTDQIEAAHDNGQTLWDLVQTQNPDMTVEQFQSTMQEARTTALQNAVADGVISQTQADWMLQRMSYRQANGFGPGSGACTGAGPRGGMQSRWAPTQG